MENLEYENSHSYFYIKNSAIKESVSHLSMFSYDCNLSYDLFDVYSEGMILREPRSFRLSSAMGEIKTNHRYIILSNGVTPVGTKELGFASDIDSYFLVLTKGAVKDKRFTALLHLGDGWQHLKTLNLDFAVELINACHNSFEKCIKNDREEVQYEQRYFTNRSFPIGMTRAGELFPIED